MMNENLHCAYRQCRHCPPTEWLYIPNPIYHLTKIKNKKYALTQKSFSCVILKLFRETERSIASKESCMNQDFLEYLLTELLMPVVHVH